MKSIIVVCGAIGIALIGAVTLVNARRSSATTIATEEYGRRLLTATSVLMGPD